jgi:hypothetical protein
MEVDQALYGRRCRSPFCWNVVCVKVVLELRWVPEILQRVVELRQQLLATQSGHKSYMESKKLNLDFKVGEEISWCHLL